MLRDYNIELKGLSEFVAELLLLTNENKILLFEGEMGSGKTTLIKEICRQLFVTDVTGSPTFSIVNQYKCQDGNTVYHFDLYRLKNKSEVFEIGMDEYIQSGKYCLIEWPEVGNDFYPDNTLKIEISGIGNHRHYRISSN